MNNFFLGLASFVIVLVPLVIIHEFGHFIAAKLSGITVLEFGIGFPPRARTLFRKGDTIYTLNWLPIGGFVRPYGEDFVKPKTEAEMATDRSEIEERGIKNPKSVFQATPWQRMFFMAAGPGINFIAALVLFIIVALVGQPYARADVTVYDIQTDSAAADAGLEEGDVIVALNGQKVESADEFNDWISENNNQALTLVVQRDGEEFETTLVATSSEETNIERVYIDSVEKSMPAYAAGFLPEDMIVAVDGIEITSVDQLQKYTRAHDGEEISVTVVRGTERLDLPVVPEKDSEGTVRIGIGIVGVEPAAVGLTAINRNEETYTRALGPGEAVKTGAEEFVRLHRLMGELVGDIFKGDVEPGAARPVSPVGIGQIGAPIFKQTLDEGEMYPIVLFAAMLSVALAVTNLLPIPGLDGGRILFVVIEIIRGKPMEPEREGLIHFIGVLLLLGLIFLTVINDIVNPINLDSLK
ncbi:MAG: RIP metalloprotease RseP [Chloroflexi bacterium]|nr:RIP metalloprotease RseP [Chloroflexota bacterium]